MTDAKKLLNKADLNAAKDYLDDYKNESLWTNVELFENVSFNENVSVSAFTVKDTWPSGAPKTDAISKTKKEVSFDSSQVFSAITYRRTQDPRSVFTLAIVQNGKWYIILDSDAKNLVKMLKESS